MTTKTYSESVGEALTDLARDGYYDGDEITAWCGDPATRLSVILERDDDSGRLFSWQHDNGGTETYRSGTIRDPQSKMTVVDIFVMVANGYYLGAAAPAYVRLASTLFVIGLGYLATSTCVALGVGRFLAHHDRDDR